MFSLNNILKTRLNETKTILINPGLKKLNQDMHITLTDLIIKNLKIHTQNYNYIALIEYNEINN